MDNNNNTNPLYTSSGMPGKTSKRYGHVSTAELKSLVEAGPWTLESIKAARVKNVAHAGFQRHVLTFKHTTALSNGDVPRLVLVNSHDGGSSVRVHLGYYRLVCANGLILGNEVFKFTARHVGNPQQNVIAAIEEAEKHVSSMLGLITRYSSRQLTQDEALKLAKAAASVRFPQSERFGLDGLLMPKREADAPNDAFTVFNRIQECLIRGGFEYEAVQTLDSGATVRQMRRARSVKSPTEQVKLNAALWDTFTKLIAA